MKKALLSFLCMFFLCAYATQDKMYLHCMDKTTQGVLISTIDSLIFGSGNIRFHSGNREISYPVGGLDSITFGANSNVIDIRYEGKQVCVLNPFAFEGVGITTDNGHVTVRSTIDSKDVVYRLTGSTTDGMFKIYSDRAFQLELNGVSITNADGPAINIQSRKSVAVVLTSQTVNTLSDSAVYAAATVTDTSTEDQKATFFSEARLSFSGDGSLIINGKGSNAHALCTDENLDIAGGMITVTSAARDGLHGQEGVTLTGGTVTVTSTGNCLDGDEGAVVIGGGSFTGTCSTDDNNLVNCDSCFQMTGGTLNLTLSGAQSKGIKCDQDMTLSGGTITINATGKAVMEATGTAGRYDPAYCTAIKCSKSIKACGTDVSIVHIGAGGKGISAGTSYVQENGTVKITVSGTGGAYVNESGVNDYYNATGISSDGSVGIQGGTLVITNSGAASKGISADGTIHLTGGNITVKPMGAAVTTVVSGTGYDPKYCTAMKSDGITTVDGGTTTLTLSGAGAKGFSTGTNFVMNDGTVNITSTGAGGTYKNSAGTTDGYQSTCITTDGTLSILGGTLTTNSSGTAGKGLNANGILTIGTSTFSPIVSVTTSGASITTSSSGGGTRPGGGGTTTTSLASAKAINSNAAINIVNGTITISSSDDGIKSETNVTVSGGTTTITKSTEGIEGKTITMNDGNVCITASDDGVNATAGTVAGGTESNDGSYFYMNGGTLTTYASSGDAIDSNGAILMSGGVMVAFGPNNSTNEDIDANGSITINGGLFFGGCMNSGMFETIASSTQTGANLKGSSAISTANGFFQIKDASGTEIGTFKTPCAYYYFHVSSPNMKASTSYSIYTGGSYTGGTTTGGYCKGGTYSGGSLKKSFTTSTSKISTLSL